MIGILQQAVTTSGGGGPVTFESFITPSLLAREASNGSYTTPLFTMNVTGGVSPYSYVWEVANGDGTLTQTSGGTTRVTLSGYNNIKTCTLRCTATDDAAATSSDEITITILFGNTNL